MPRDSFLPIGQQCHAEQRGRPAGSDGSVDVLSGEKLGPAREPCKIAEPSRAGPENRRWLLSQIEEAVQPMQFIIDRRGELAPRRA